MNPGINIYGLVDPRTNAVRYVGRTKQRLPMRLHQHIGNARRVKYQHARAKWIRELLEAGLKPLITLLEKTNDENQIAEENKWFGRFLNLVNSGTAAQGGNRSYVVKWTPELDLRLGKDPDALIAEDIGVTRKAVSYRRKVLGIAASFNRARNTPPPRNADRRRIALPSWVLNLLGTMSDQMLADKANVSKRTINRARRKKGIISYALSSGNTGRFQEGSYPMRWLKQNP